MRPYVKITPLLRRIFRFIVVLTVIQNPLIAAGQSTEASAEDIKEEAIKKEDKKPKAKQETTSTDNEQTIIITGDRTPTPANQSLTPITVIERQQIEQSGAEDLGSLARTIPGLDVYEGIRGPSIRLQGLQGSQVLILINGSRTGGAIGGSIDLSQFKTGEIEQIEILRGPAAVIYGSDALGGVVNIITKKPIYVDKSWEVRASSFRSLQTNASFGFHKDDRDIQISPFFTNQAPWEIEKKDPSDNTLQISGIGQTEFGFSQRLTKGQALADDNEGNIYWDQSLRLSQRNLWDDYTTAQGAQMQRTNTIQTAHFNLKPIWFLTSNQSISAQLGHYYSEDIYELDQAYSNVLDKKEVTTERKYESKWLWQRKAESLKLTAGIDIDQDNLVSDRLGANAQPRDRLGGFGRISYRIYDQYWVTPGIRGDDDSLFGRNTTRSLALAYIGAAFRANLAAGEGYRAPDFKQLYMEFINQGANYQVIGNPDLKPEKSINYTLTLAFDDGSQHLLNSPWSSQFSLWYNLVDQLISTTEVAAQGSLRTFQYSNVAEIETKGASIAVSWEKGPLYLNLGQQVQETRETSRSNELSGIPRNDTKIDVRYTKKAMEDSLGWQIGLNLQRIGETNYYDSNSQAYLSKPRGLVNLQFRQTLSKDNNGGRLRWFLKGQNLTDEWHPQELSVRPLSFELGIKRNY